MARHCENAQAVATRPDWAANLSAAMTKFRTALLVLSLAISGAAAAQGLLGPTSNEDQFLPVDQAFVFSAIADGGETVLLDWQIAPGYYLYRHRMSVKTATPGFSLGEIALPDGKKKTDEFFGDVEVYYDVLGAKLPVVRPGDASSFELAVSYQGCADAGLCYPPVTKTVSIEMPPPGTPSASDARANGLGTGSPLEPDCWRQPVRHHGELLWIWPAACLYALRAADDPDPVRNHRRPGRSCDPAAIVPAVPGLRPRHGADLHDRGRRIRGRRPTGAGFLPATLDHHYFRGSFRRPRACDVRALRPQGPVRAGDEASRACRDARNQEASSARQSWVRYPRSS